MDRKKVNGKYLWLLPLLVIALVSGCWLVSGTWVIIYEVEDADIFATEHFYKFTVDLTKESIWQDHKDDLDNIEDIAFTFKLINQGADTATAQVYVSPDDTLTVMSSATIILDGLSVPPDSTFHVTMAHYYELLQNFETLRDLVITGNFTAYAVVPDTVNVKFRDVVVVITISAGL